MRIFLKLIPVSIFLICGSASISKAQSLIIDQVAAVIGNEMIMQSDIEKQIIELKAEGVPVKPNYRCELLSELLEQKLMVNQAKLDSVQISDASVAMQLEGRLDHFTNYFGSQKEMEDYFGKSVLQIKEDFHDLIREQMLMEEMRKTITEDIRITPSEVKEFYASLPKDSIPTMDARMEVQQIVRYPKYTDEAISKVKDKLLDMRKKILEGSSFSTMAVLYSQDPGSAKLGGEIGFRSKSELDPEYARVAFTLKEGQVSKIVESEFGYHIIQMIERRGDRVNTRHILLNPEVSQASLDETRKTLDTLLSLIKKDSMSFPAAAYVYSGDKNSFMNGGLRINPKSGNSYFEMNDFTPEEYYVVKDLKQNDITYPFQTKDENGKPVYKLMRIKTKTNPHPANIKEDYQYLQELALAVKKKKAIEEWVLDKQKSTTFYIDSSFDRCNLSEKGWINH
jgi:peptidyl-prolyl cis-trans isomerase SurA